MTEKAYSEDFCYVPQKLRLVLLRIPKNQMTIHIFFREKCDKLLLMKTSLVVTNMNNH